VKYLSNQINNTKMKKTTLLLIAAGMIAGCDEPIVTTQAAAMPKPVAEETELYVDVHNLEPGKVTFDDVMNAHHKDLATQGKFGVQFRKFWIDEEKGKVYCLSSAPNPEAVTKTHQEAHGLAPASVYQVTDGAEEPAVGNKQYFLDVHELGAGNVTVAAVADAHRKDLAVQAKHGVHFVNYWVDDKTGTVLCLSQAADSGKVIATHREAHGLIPAYTLKVKQGE
jgi:hypothetical protein